MFDHSRCPRCASILRRAFGLGCQPTAGDIPHKWHAAEDSCGRCGCPRSEHIMDGNKVGSCVAEKHSEYPSCGPLCGCEAFKDIEVVKVDADEHS